MGDKYGKATPDFIKLPNFQGYFLRGLDADGIIDKDRKGKEAGHDQKDMIKEHTHTIVGRKENRGDKGSRGIHVYRDEHEVTTSINKEGGYETRPVNIAVYWIIRIK